jgi:hypothetical protein
MKYFNKKWFELINGSNINMFMRVTKEAETFSEEYFQELYKFKLSEFLKLYQEISELSPDDIFNVGSWDTTEIENETGEHVDSSGQLSAHEFEQDKADIHLKEQEARDRYVPEVYDEELLTKKFNNLFDEKKKHFEDNLPDEIKSDIADIRVLALDNVSKDIEKRINQFYGQKEEQAMMIDCEYQKYYKSIITQLPEKIQTKYGFHDCKATHFEQQGTDAILELDHSGGFTNVCKVIYHNAIVIEQENIIGTRWVRDEVYLVDGLYEFHAALQDENAQVRYLTIKASDIDFIMDGRS